MTTQTLTLPEFLLARIAEDETPTWELVPRPRWMGGPAGFVGHRCFICDETSHGGTPEAMSESAREHDEKIHRRSRVLAECAAKRAIVAEHQITLTEESDGWWEGRCSSCFGEAGIVGEWVGNDPQIACYTLRALASVYADHEDWREEWAL